MRRDRGRSDAFVDRIAAVWAERGYGLWALERRDTGDFIGYTGLWPAEFEAPFTPAVEVGWRLAAAHWGQGRGDFDHPRVPVGHPTRRHRLYRLHGPPGDAPEG